MNLNSMLTVKGGLLSLCDDSFGRFFCYRLLH